MTLWEQAVRYKWKTKSAKPIAKHDMAHPSGYPLLLSKGSPTSPFEYEVPDCVVEKVVPEVHNARWNAQFLGKPSDGFPGGCSLTGFLNVRGPSTLFISWEMMLTSR